MPIVYLRKPPIGMVDLGHLPRAILNNKHVRCRKLLTVAIKIQHARDEQGAQSCIIFNSIELVGLQIVYT